MLLTVGSILGLAAVAPAARAQSSEPPASVEEEVRANVLAQPVGDHRVADYALPDAFVARIADRVICSSYQQRYRVVVHDAPPAADAPPMTTHPAPRAARTETSPDGAPAGNAPTDTAPPPAASDGPVALGLIAVGVLLVVGLVWWRMRGRG